MVGRGRHSRAPQIRCHRFQFAKREGVYRVVESSPSGEQGNGDNLVMIEDQRVATSYAIEALRVFDHLHFRTLMSDAFAGGHTSSGKSAAAGAAKTSKTKATSKTKTKTAKGRNGRVQAVAAPSPNAAKKPGRAAAMAALTLQISGKPAWFANFYKD